MATQTKQREPGEWADQPLTRKERRAARNAARVREHNQLLAAADAGRGETRRIGFMGEANCPPRVRVNQKRLAEAIATMQ